MSKESKGRLKRVGRQLRERLDKAKEYQVVESQYVYEDEYRPVYAEGYITYHEYDLAERLKKKLLSLHQDQKLEKVIPGCAIKTDAGVCYHIAHKESTGLVMVDSALARHKITSELTLLRGIGVKTADRLKREGYNTIEDLKQHPRFGEGAKDLLKIVEQCDTAQMIDWMGQWLPRSHSLVLCSSAFRAARDFIILDIETMGLFTRPIILFGLAEIGEGGAITVHQYLLRDIDEEPAALSAVLGHIGKNSVFVTFNGRSFDLPYIRERLAYYGMDADLGHPHFDILHFSRRAFREFVPDCRLTTLEKHLFGTVRQDDLPSALVPEFYETYLLTKNCGPLVPIVEHNRQDLISLANIFSELNKILAKS